MGAQAVTLMNSGDIWASTMHAGFAEFAAFDQDAVDNRAFVAAGKLDVPVLALGGEKSFGASGNPQPIALGNNVTVYLPCWKDLRLDGTCFEGEGIAPDIEVRATTDDLAAGDPLPGLDQGIDRLERRQHAAGVLDRARERHAAVPRGRAGRARQPRAQLVVARLRHLAATQPRTRQPVSSPCSTAAFKAFLEPLYDSHWHVYAKRPFAGPAAVLAYLSRYTHRAAISNRRLLALDERGVTFRWKDYRAKGRQRQKVMTLASEIDKHQVFSHFLDG